MGTKKDRNLWTTLAEYIKKGWEKYPEELYKKDSQESSPAPQFKKAETLLC